MCKNEFCKQILFLIFSVLLVVVSCIGLIQLIVGGVFYAQCPYNQFIIIYNITSGVFSIVIFLLISILVQIMYKSKSGHNEHKFLLIILISIIIFLALFLLGWTIAGNANAGAVHIGNYTSTETGSSSYCHPTLVTSSFVLMIIYSIALYGLCLLIIMVLPFQNR